MPETSAEDVAFWTDHCVPPYASLLRSTGTYTEEQIDDHVKWFKEFIIPAIGPKPKAGAAYLMAHTGSIIEISVNFSDNRNPIIRFIFQPMDSIKSIPNSVNADMSWFEQFAAVFCVPEADLPALKAKLPPQIASIPNCLLGFDLDKASRSMKAYFSPLYKHLLTGENTDKVIFDLMKSLRPAGQGFEPALKLLEDFRSAEQVRNIDVVGFDCIKPEAGARIKLYTRLAPGENTFAHVEHHLTLGGRLTDGLTLKEVELLRDIWHLLLDEPEGFAQRTSSKTETDLQSPHSGMMVSWEVQSGNPLPSPKLYVPRWTFTNSNKNIAEGYEKIFDKWGWGWGANGKYRRTIEEAL